jgi:hypothetical protein
MQNGIFNKMLLLMYSQAIEHALSDHTQSQTISRGWLSQRSGFVSMVHLTTISI